jgi:hypothetical protein
MAKTLTESAVEKLRVEAKISGNHPGKIAKYSAAKTEYRALVATLFDEEDHPYVGRASDSYLEQLKAAAESPEATEADVARYDIILDRTESGAGPDVKETRLTGQELCQVLADGTALTEAHVKEAARLVVQNSSTDNRVLHSALKTRLQQQKAGYIQPVVDPPQPRKVTEADVEAAREKARQTSRIEDRAAYAAIKGELAQQIEGAAE